jgi:hypothetical protein
MHFLLELCFMALFQVLVFDSPSLILQLLVDNFGVIDSEAIAALCLALTSTLLYKPTQPP